MELNASGRRANGRRGNPQTKGHINMLRCKVPWVRLDHGPNPFLPPFLSLTHTHTTTTLRLVPALQRLAATS